MTIPRLNSIMKNWEVVPPKISLLAGIAGWDSSKVQKPKELKEKSNEEKLTELLGMFPVLGA